VASFNQAIVMGHLGQDPRANQAGTKADFSLATNERKKDDRGEWVDHTEWHRVVCFGKTAEAAVRFLKKGSPALVSGRLQTRKYTGQDGVEKSVTEILADRIQFLGGGGGAQESRQGAGDSGPSRGSAPSSGGFSGPTGGMPAEDDDLAF